MLEKKEEGLLKLIEPVRCPKCGTSYRNAVLGIYVCSHCGHEEANSFGKVRAFLEQHGRSPAIIISDATGVPITTIDQYLRQGRLEIPEGSHVYIHCEKCNTEIRYGRFCQDCALELCKNIQVAFSSLDIGEKPKVNAKFQFLDERRKGKG